MIKQWKWSKVDHKLLFFFIKMDEATINGFVWYFIGACYSMTLITISITHDLYVPYLLSGPYYASRQTVPVKIWTINWFSASPYSTNAIHWICIKWDIFCYSLGTHLGLFCVSTYGLRMNLMTIADLYIHDKTYF